MKSITTAEMKSMNRSKVYRLIYDEGQISKQAITQKLGLSLPTVTQDLNELLEKNMIRSRGLFKSTGGRRAAVFECNPVFRVAIGIEVLVDQLNIAAVDIYGEVLEEATFELAFAHSEDYYKTLGDWANAFIGFLPFDAASVLGVAIAVQGLVSPDGEHVTYSKILNARGITRSDFARHIAYPCRILHDANAAAFSELWALNNVDNAIFISLNKYIGSSLIIGGSIYTGRELCSSTLEHMLLYPGGKPCYCGRHGCVEAYCSVNALTEQSGESLDIFFEKLRSGDERRAGIWSSYLNDLAITINNARMIIDCDIIFSGILLPYITDEDFESVKDMARSHSAFDFSNFEIIKAKYRKKAAVVGSALYNIDKFLQEFR